MSSQTNSSLPSDIDRGSAIRSFMNQRDALTLLLQDNLLTITSKLYSKSIISQNTVLEVMNQMHIASVRTVSLLRVVEAKIRVEPNSFAEFVKILESEPPLKSQAEELVKSYHNSSNKTVNSPAAVSRYGEYLKGVYGRSSVSNDGKFPPTPSKKYVNLAVVSWYSDRRDLEELIRHTLHGNVDEILKEKEKIEIDDILKPDKNGKAVPLIFIEGPPGIGKSTLAWELCRRWDKKQYNLVVLLRLRKREVRQIKDIAGLFPHYDKDLQRSVARDAMDTEGEGVLFILDGYDELPVNLRHEGLLVDLLKGEALPKCSVLVTSRPSATRNFMLTCRPLVERRIEILGFTDECVKEYASSVFCSEPELLEDFLLYVSASKNPAINSLMYIPLNAAIIVEIYRNDRRKGFPISTTTTQLYTQLCLAILQRHLESADPLCTTDMTDFSDLSSTFYGHFIKLAELAYKKLEQHEVVFYSDSVPKKLIHFGFLDSVPALFGGGGTSYNFLHLTLQEFLAAYHITQLSNGTDVFDRYCNDPHWNMVWRFVSGLTSFKYFKDNAKDTIFATQEEEYFQVSVFLMQCLFEAQIQFDYKTAFEGAKLRAQSSNDFFPLDMYALGYCLANCSSTTTWEVELHDTYHFISGLNSSSTSGHGIISHLMISDATDLLFLDHYPIRILQGIEHLTIDSTSYLESHMHGTEVSLARVLPLMKEFSFLSLNSHTFLSVDLVTQLSHSNVTTLECGVSGYGLDSARTIESLANLPRNLKILRINEDLRRVSYEINTKPLCDTIFSSPALKSISLSLEEFTENSFTLLETNTNVIAVYIKQRRYFSPKVIPVDILAQILQRNKTIETLSWNYIDRHLDSESVEKFNRVLSFNTTLKELVIYVTKYLHTAYPDIVMQLASDSRVKLMIGSS